MYLEVFVYFTVIRSHGDTGGLQTWGTRGQPVHPVAPRRRPSSRGCRFEAGGSSPGGFLCVEAKHHIVRWINYWYAALVVWNLCIILVLQHR